MSLTDAELELARRNAKLLSTRINSLCAAYRGKAENIVRFFDGLGMTKEQKISFLAKEFATVHVLAPLRAGRKTSATGTESRQHEHQEKPIE